MSAASANQNSSSLDVNALVQPSEIQRREDSANSIIRFKVQRRKSSSFLHWARMRLILANGGKIVLLSADYEAKITYQIIAGLFHRCVKLMFGMMAYF